MPHDTPNGLTFGSSLNPGDESLMIIEVVRRIHFDGTCTCAGYVEVHEDSSGGRAYWAEAWTGEDGETTYCGWFDNRQKAAAAILNTSTIRK